MAIQDQRTAEILTSSHIASSVASFLDPYVSAARNLVCRAWHLWEYDTVTLIVRGIPYQADNVPKWSTKVAFICKNMGYFPYQYKSSKTVKFFDFTKKIRVKKGDHARVFNHAINIFDDDLIHKEFQQLATLDDPYINIMIGNEDGEEDFDIDQTLRTISSLNYHHSYIHKIKTVGENMYEIMWQD